MKTSPALEPSTDVTVDPLVSPTCPLCLVSAGELFHEDHRDRRAYVRRAYVRRAYVRRAYARRAYVRCPLCLLVFVPPHQFLTPEEEKSEYDRHENSPDDPRYRRFLDRLFNPLVKRLDAGSRGLDFGSGPGPTLSVMFEEAGHSMALYDPFYAPHTDALERTYDFIVASEVVEHLHRPRRELERLWTCLKPGGWLGLMTKRVISRDAFSTWHYKADPTHVCFFSIPTFRWLADHWGAEWVVAEKDVVLFKKR